MRKRHPPSYTANALVSMSRFSAIQLKEDLSRNSADTWNLNRRWNDQIQKLLIQKKFQRYVRENIFGLKVKVSSYLTETLGDQSLKKR